jgi:hypothetical protein
MESNGTTALAVLPTPIASNASTALEPSTAEQAFWLASQLVKSGLLGRSVQRPEAAFAIILAGRELGLTAMQSLRSIHIIEGKPTLSSDLMAALVMRSPTCEYFQLVESTNTIARYVTKRVGAKNKETPMSFTWEDAKLAGVTNKNNWKTYPAAMLRARCIASLARVVYPDLLMGIYETDEISEPKSMPSVREASPSEPPPADESDANAVAMWSAKMQDAESVEALEALRLECKAAVTDAQALLAISLAYGARKKELNPDKPKES